MGLLSDAGVGQDALGATSGPAFVAEGLVLLTAEIVRLLPRDVSLTTASTLMALRRSGPRRLSDLAATEGVTQPSMTDLVTRLERDGLAERRRDPDDRRVVWVALTATGEDFVGHRYEGAALRLAELIRELPPVEVAALAAALPALAHLRQLGVPSAGRHGSAGAA